ncbi:MAG: YgiQ family radical SAM protein [Tannerellaceae bacterium]|jgi:uncharacterized radical SAM protein YgiQ|nr:YgiQ family radical SAM protein [Tannerellaceae bacterium]
MKTRKDWLPITLRDLEARGWEEVDVILFTGDAYVDHPSFGAAVIGRVLEAEGVRTALVAQPDWRGDYRDFRKLGRPRMFFGVSAGAMDSMVNRYTARKRLRSEDAYSPEARPGMRPDYPSIVYTRILKTLYPEVPVVLGGIEASMRRLTHYDYWEDALRPGILVDSRADMLIYGMGEQPLKELVARLRSGEELTRIRDLRQTAFLVPEEEVCSLPPVRGRESGREDVRLFSHEECLGDKKKQAQNFRRIEEESNSLRALRLIQGVGREAVVVNPPFPPMTQGELDASFDLPYTRMPHPKYRGKRIPAYEMIRFSVNIHRGCFGGCAFCTISAHQGKFVVSRSAASILAEVERIGKMPDFKGYLSDLGGPSANMYRMGGCDRGLCRSCRKPSCIFPAVCPNLSTDHGPLLEIYRAADRMPGIRKSFIGSGLRYDLLLHAHRQEAWQRAAAEYTRELVERHLSGRLKVAPEHTSPRVLELMRKPPFALFLRFRELFHRLCRKAGLDRQLIPYFISSHPGCTEEDMAELAVETKRLDFRPEQVQDFTPTPMTLATEIYYTGYHPYTLEKIPSARTPEEKQAQNKYFFWYRKEFRPDLLSSLRRLGRQDLLAGLFGPRQR